MKMKTLRNTLVLAGLVTSAALATHPAHSGAQELRRIDDYTIQANVSLYSGFPALNDDGTINVVVEVPAGTGAKWEVEKDGLLKWEWKNGRPRVVKYLPYPGNYGMIPRTLQEEEDGGDGDALDVLILGSAIERGRVVPAELIRVLRLLDDGERDDKLLAVIDESPLEVDDLEELEKKFPGVATIVATWFGNYKGPGEIELQGFEGRKKAEKIVQDAARAYEKHAADR